MRLIDADAIKLPKGFFEKVNNVPKFYEWLDELPTIEPERRKGEWIDKPDPFDFFDTIPVCSECGRVTRYREKTNFCPNCGADMRGEQE